MSLNRALTVLLAVLLSTAAGCRQGMYDQARYEPYEASDIFADGAAAQLPPEHTVPRGHLRDDTVLYSGVDAAGAFADAVPASVGMSPEVMRRGQQRFDVFCQPCHGLAGAGDGMIVQRGFKQPNSFHDDEVRERPLGYYVNVMAEGFGVMPSYASQVPAADRWAIAAYIRALQTSRAFPGGRAALPAQPSLPADPDDLEGDLEDETVTPTLEDLP